MCDRKYYLNIKISTIGDKKFMSLMVCFSDNTTTDVNHLASTISDKKFLSLMICFSDNFSVVTE